MKKSFGTFVFISLLMMALQGYAAEVVYNKFNLHVHEHTDRNGTVYKANYTGFIAPVAVAKPFIVPPGTALEVGKWQKGFTLKNQKNGMLIYYEFSRRNMKMQVGAYIDLITSAQPELLPGLTKVDMKGIRAGKALVGMTRNGVLTALGYPAKHKTPSLEGASWTYWKDRWRTLRVSFGRNGKVARVIE